MLVFHLSHVLHHIHILYLKFLKYRLVVEIPITSGYSSVFSSLHSGKFIIINYNFYFASWLKYSGQFKTMASKDPRKTDHPLKDDASQDGQQPPFASTSSGDAAPSHDANSQQAANSRSYSSKNVQGGSPNVTNANNSVVSPSREQGTHTVKV